MSLWAAIAVGALTGLASAPHCAAMCGPVAAFACRGGERSAPLRYQLGRMLSYSALGAGAGSLGVAVSSQLSSAVAGAVFSFTLALGLGLAAYRLWHAGSPAPAALVRLGRSSRKRSWWRRLPTDPGALGLLTALLPCGALMAAGLLAAGSGSVAGGVAIMLAFSLTSSVGLLGAAYAARALIRRPGASRVLALVLALGAIVLVVRPLRALSRGSSVCHGVSCVGP
ncbi:MAG: sulfite exporter TauE/SafE family protein [Deltaproteobacteria bacterium]|nr:sulfite exporter TauE/SafE family protein [Deltaproteobacteria bacterium]